MKLSVVATLYYSEKYIEEFHARISGVLETITDDYEIVLVNDGSPDNALQKALQLQEKDDRVIVVDLSRNFGHHKAIVTGLQVSRGEYVFLIDIDLEEDPELLGQFWQVYQQAGDVDSVFGAQVKRKGYWVERIGGMLFYALFSVISDVDYPESALTARLMSRRYVDAVLRYQEREVELRGVFALAGFRQKMVWVTKRHRGSTTYTFRKRLRFAIDSITSFSSRPLTYIFWLGCTISIIAFVSLAAILVDKFLWAGDVEGWASIMASVWLVGGVIMFSMGIIGIYLSKMFLEIKNRPLTIIRDIYRRK
jgi:putative glycosyltransferase